MAGKSKEPERLRRGRAFHAKVQKDWLFNAEGSPTIERSVTTPSDRRGRIDVYVDDNEGVVALVEIKHTDWDRMSPTAVRRNVRRQVRQIWRYVESQLRGLGRDKQSDVCAGVVFPSRPSDPNRLEFIEGLFEEEGIAVVWEDESVEQRAARAGLHTKPP